MSSNMRRSSLKFKYAKPSNAGIDEDYAPYVSSDDEVDDAKKDKLMNNHSSYKSLWIESDLKRKKFATKLDRLEELNKMIEERIKKMIHAPDSAEADDSGKLSQFPLRPQGMKRKDRSTERGTHSSDTGKSRKVEGPSTKSPTSQTSASPERKSPRKGIVADDDAGDMGSTTTATAYKPLKPFAEEKFSEFSLEKVLGLCRTKMQNIKARREEMFRAMPRTTTKPKNPTTVGKKDPEKKDSEKTPISSPRRDSDKKESDKKDTDKKDSEKKDGDAKDRKAKTQGTEQDMNTSSSTTPNVSILVGSPPASPLRAGAPAKTDQSSIQFKADKSDLSCLYRSFNLGESTVTQRNLREVPSRSSHVKGQPTVPKDADTSKLRINLILKEHAQKLSTDSLKSGNVAGDAQKPRGGAVPAKGARKPGKPVESKTEADKPPGAVAKKGTEPTKPAEESDAKKDKKEGDTSAETPNPEESAKAAEEGPKEGAAGPPDAKQETEEDKKPAANRGAKKDQAEETKKIPGYIMSALIGKNSTPFKNEAKAAEGKPADAKAEAAAPPEPSKASPPSTTTTTSKPSTATNPSQAILLNSMVSTISKQEKRERVHDIGKGSDQMLKTKCTRSAELRDLVTQAIKDHKIFCIFDNHWYIVRPVREELLNRGWIEVIPDRRLIPRRKPPPAGPTVDRRRSSTDYTVEAILTAREAFEDVQDFAVRTPPVKTSFDKAKVARRNSDDSLRETLSEFRIVPPSTERKKNNVDIREFVTKVQNQMTVQTGKETPKGGEREAKGKTDKKGKKLYSAAVAGSDHQNKAESTGEVKSAVPIAGDANKTSAITMLTPVSKSLQAIIDSISGNNSSKKDGEEGARDHGNKAAAESEETNKAPKFVLTEAEAKIASKIIQSSNARIHFMWLSIKPAIHLKCFNYNPEIVNKFQKTTFCTKIGLWSHLNNIQWYAHEVHYPAKSPRMYNTGEADDLQAFFQDFQMTACIGLLKWLSETFYVKGVKGVQKKKGKVPIKAFEFAIRQCERYIRFRENEDLNIVEEPKVLQEEWNTFLQWYYVITNEHGKVQESSHAQLMVLYTKALEILRAMKRHWPEIDVDGRLNIWIMKPYCASCGRGIFMTNNVYYIGQHSKYIVQKYIEKPLLIYNTKFDIRQWFLITKLIPLEIWMYKECYLRFCTQPFALRNLHESVHLSNNSVQRKYVSQKDSSLPDQNMWDSNTFQQYLKTIGHPNAWSEIIYPGMRDAIISIMLASQDTFDTQRRSWFEVYGADFMISSNLKDGPWLIEINENPAMDPSTKVTARLCPQMLRDVIKVIVDKRTNKSALTGQWELVYRQNYSPSYGTIDTDVKGKRIARLSPTVKSGMASNSVHPPPFFLSCMNSASKKKGEADKDSEAKKQYEIVKSYNAKKGKLSSESEFEKQLRPKLNSPSKVRARGKLAKESSSSCMDKSQVQVKKLPGVTSFESPKKCRVNWNKIKRKML